MSPKIVLIGGGSYSWGPTVLGNILGKQDLDDAHVVLHDINPEALERNFRLAERFKQVAGARVIFEQTTDRRAALDGAGYAVVTISTGGLAGLIGPITTSIEREEPWLTLHGLRLVWEKNQS